MRTTPPIHVATPVWGETYTRTFVDYCLPAQLAPGNAPFLASMRGCGYTIFTTTEDAKRLTAAAAYQTLSRIIPVTVALIDDNLRAATASGNNKYHVKSDCYRRALKRAVACDAALLSLNADIVLANGFVRTVAELLAAGKRVIEVPGPRGLREPIGNVLRSTYLNGDDGSITISPSDLSGLWARHMHPQLEMHFVEGPEGAPFHPSHLYWPIPFDGAVIRGFHLYPIVVYPGNNGVNFTSTIDDDLVGNLAPSPEEVFLAQDSRTMFCCELSPPDHYVGRAVDRGDPDHYVAFYLGFARHNFLNLDKEILITGSANLGAEWEVQRGKSRRFVKDLARRYTREVRRLALREYARRIANTRDQVVTAGRSIAQRLWRRVVPHHLRRAVHLASHALRRRDPR